MSWRSWWKVQFAACRNLSLSAFGSGILHTLGIVWLFIQLIYFLWPEYDQEIRDWSWWALALGALEGFRRAWPKLSVKSQISGTDAVIEIRVCNLFDQKEALVVSSNTTFDTSMEDETISRRSTQGQYTELFCDNLANLDRQIEDSLEGVNFALKDNDSKPYGKTKEYPIGTVANVMCSGKRAYFLAVGRMDRNHVANASKSEVLDALPRLWGFVRSRGGLEPIAVPIVGSGFARTRATREELIREIAKSFIAAVREGRFCEHLTIAVSPDDFWGKSINLSALGRFLEHEGTYDAVSSSEPQEDQVEGAHEGVVRQAPRDGD